MYNTYCGAAIVCSATDLLITSAAHVDHGRSTYTYHFTSIYTTSRNKWVYKNFSKHYTTPFQTIEQPQKYRS